MDAHKPGTLHVLEANAASRNHEEEGHEQLVGALNLGHEEGQVNKFPWLELGCLLPSMMHGMEAEVLH